MRSFHHRSTLFIGVLVMLLDGVFVFAQESPRVPTQTTFQQIEIALEALESSPNAPIAAVPIQRAKRLLTDGRLQAAAGKLRAAGFTADRLDAILGLIALMEQNAATAGSLKAVENEIAASKAHLDELKAQLKSAAEVAAASSPPSTESLAEKDRPPETGAVP